MEYKNYIPLEKISLRYKYFCFIDTKEYLADALFIKNKVRVWFQNEAHKPDTDFVFIFCKVRSYRADMQTFVSKITLRKNRPFEKIRFAQSA